MDLAPLAVQHSNANAHAELLTVTPAHPNGQPDVPPDGDVQLSWVDFSGIPRSFSLHSWLRMENWLLRPGDHFLVEVQARARRDLSLALHANDQMCVFTCDPTDFTNVTVGDTARFGWLYGVAFKGVQLRDSPKAHLPTRPAIHPRPIF